MLRKETLQDELFRLKQLAKNSKDLSTSFRYKSNTENRIVTIKNS